MSKRQPTGPPPPPVVQRMRLQYAKRGRMRFASHRDLARALERAIRRAGVPIAFSAGFTPHPKISYIGAAPTGAASEAEYFEIGLAGRVDVEALRLALDAALPAGVDVSRRSRRAPPGSPTGWRRALGIELPGADAGPSAAALAAFAAGRDVVVQRTTKNGVRDVDARAAVLSSARVSCPAGRASRPVRYWTWSYGRCSRRAARRRTLRAACPHRVRRPAAAPLRAGGAGSDDRCGPGVGRRSPGSRSGGGPGRSPPAGEAPARSGVRPAQTSAGPGRRPATRRTASRAVAGRHRLRSGDRRARGRERSTARDRAHRRPPTAPPGPQPAADTEATRPPRRTVRRPRVTPARPAASTAPASAPPASARPAKKAAAAKKVEPPRSTPPDRATDAATAAGGAAADRRRPTPAVAAAPGRSAVTPSPAPAAAEAPPSPTPPPRRPSPTAAARGRRRGRGTDGAARRRAVPAADRHAAAPPPPRPRARRPARRQLDAPPSPRCRHRRRPPHGRAPASTSPPPVPTPPPRLRRPRPMPRTGARTERRDRHRTPLTDARRRRRSRRRGRRVARGRRRRRRPPRPRPPEPTDDEARRRPTGRALPTTATARTRPTPTAPRHRRRRDRSDAPGPTAPTARRLRRVRRSTADDAEGEPRRPRPTATAASRRRRRRRRRRRVAAARPTPTPTPPTAPRTATATTRRTPSSTSASRRGRTVAPRRWRRTLAAERGGKDSGKAKDGVAGVPRRRRPGRRRRRARRPRLDPAGGQAPAPPRRPRRWPSPRPGAHRGRVPRPPRGRRPRHGDPAAGRPHPDRRARGRRSRRALRHPGERHVATSATSTSAACRTCCRAWRRPSSTSARVATACSTPVRSTGTPPASTASHARSRTRCTRATAVLVQVTKDPVGHKGARLTSQVCLPGRYLVYVPGGGMTGISRRAARHRALPAQGDPEEGRARGRRRHRAHRGRGCERGGPRPRRRTARGAVGVDPARATKKTSAPELVYGEPDLAIRVVRDVFNEDVTSLVVQGEQAYARGLVVPRRHGAGPRRPGREVHRHRSTCSTTCASTSSWPRPSTARCGCPPGGSLVIDRTEAMTVVDVNTGKFIGSGGNLEETVTRNNLEAAEEIVRQLRLRDVGGIIVIDFIDMVLESNRDLVLRRLTECLGRDRTKHQVAEVTSLGLVQMTRKRVGEGLLEAFSDDLRALPRPRRHGPTEPVDQKPRRGDGSDDDDGAEQDRGPAPTRQGCRPRRCRRARARAVPKVAPVDEEQAQGRRRGHGRHGPHRRRGRGPVGELAAGRGRGRMVETIADAVADALGRRRGRPWPRSRRRQRRRGRRRRRARSPTVAELRRASPTRPDRPRSAGLEADPVDRRRGRRGARTPPAAKKAPRVAGAAARRPAGAVEADAAVPAGE